MNSIFLVILYYLVVQVCNISICFVLTDKNVLIFLPDNWAPLAYIFVTYGGSVQENV